MSIRPHVEGIYKAHIEELKALPEMASILDGVRHARSMTASSRMSSRPTSARRNSLVSFSVSHHPSLSST